MRAWTAPSDNRTALQLAPASDHPAAPNKVDMLLVLESQSTRARSVTVQVLSESTIHRQPAWSKILMYKHKSLGASGSKIAVPSAACTTNGLQYNDARTCVRAYTRALLHLNMLNAAVGHADAPTTAGAAVLNLAATAAELAPLCRHAAAYISTACRHSNTTAAGS